MQYKAYINGKLHELGQHVNGWNAYMFAIEKFGPDSHPKIKEDQIKTKIINLRLPEILKPQA